MARAAARAAAPPAPARRGRARPIEEDVLLTAMLCLVAFGAVMVYSASSASTVIKGGGDGTAFLVKYVMYGAVGLRRDVGDRAHVAAAHPRPAPARCWPSRSACSCSCGCPASA